MVIFLQKREPSRVQFVNIPTIILVSNWLFKAFNIMLSCIKYIAPDFPSLSINYAENLIYFSPNLHFINTTMNEDKSIDLLIWNNKNEFWTPIDRNDSAKAGSS